MNVNLADNELVGESVEARLLEKMPQSLEKRTQLFTHF